MSTWLITYQWQTDNMNTPKLHNAILKNNRPADWLRNMLRDYPQEHHVLLYAMNLDGQINGEIVEDLLHLTA